MRYALHSPCINNQQRCDEVKRLLNDLCHRANAFIRRHLPLVVLITVYILNALKLTSSYEHSWRYTKMLNAFAL